MKFAGARADAVCQSDKSGSPSLPPVGASLPFLKPGLCQCVCFGTGEVSVDLDARPVETKTRDVLFQLRQALLLSIVVAEVEFRARRFVTMLDPKEATGHQRQDPRDLLLLGQAKNASFNDDERTIFQECSRKVLSAHGNRHHERRASEDLCLCQTRRQPRQDAADESPEFVGSEAERFKKEVLQTLCR